MGLDFFGSDKSIFGVDIFKGSSILGDFLDQQEHSDKRHYDWNQNQLSATFG